MMRVACLAFASLLIGCTFDASGKGSETGSTSETEGSGSGESSAGEAGSEGSGSSSTTDQSSSTTDASSSTTDASSSTTDASSSTTDPTTASGTGTDTDPTTGTDTDPTTGPDTDPTTGPDTDPTAGTDTDPTTGGQDCGEQPDEGLFAQCFETEECVDSEHCVVLQGSGGQIIDGHCTNFCQFDDQCPVPAGCDVKPVCQSLTSLNGGSACLLDCTQSQECPIGMECITVQLGYDICM